MSYSPMKGSEYSDRLRKAVQSYCTSERYTVEAVVPEHSIVAEERIVIENPSSFRGSQFGKKIDGAIRTGYAKSSYIAVIADVLARKFSDGECGCAYFHMTKGVSNTGTTNTYICNATIPMTTVMEEEGVTKGIAALMEMYTGLPVFNQLYWTYNLDTVDVYAEAAVQYKDGVSEGRKAIQALCLNVRSEYFSRIRQSYGGVKAAEKFFACEGEVEVYARRQIRRFR